jgi:hypothetical protein
MIHGYLDGEGKVKQLTASPANSLFVGQVQGMVQGLFPKLKRGARPGDTWADTIEVVNNAGGNNTVIKSYIRYTAGGPDPVAGVPAMKLNSTTQSTVVGTIDNPMTGTMEVEGTGTGTSILHVGLDGRLLGLNASNTVDQKLKVSVAPTPIPVKTVQTLVITLLK